MRPAHQSLTGALMAAMMALSSPVGSSPARAQNATPAAPVSTESPNASPNQAGHDQADAAPRDDTITVTGRRVPDVKEVQALARAITPHLSPDEPLARFTDPVCFGAAGLPRPLLETVADRLLFDAQQAGIDLAGEHCKPNVLVLFVDDGEAEITELAKNKAWLFGDMELSEIRRIVKEPGPVHVWTVSEIRSRDGDRISVDSITGVKRLNVPIASFIVLPVRRDIQFSVMLIDRKAVLGMSLMQIADYAAMRTLAMVRPKGATGGDTILTLFDRDAAARPQAMTDFDRGYLKALYAGAGNERSTMKVGEIARNIVKDAKKGRVVEP